MDSQNPQLNRLLHDLDAESRRRVFAQLQPVALINGQVLYEQDGRQGFAYFPTNSIVSMLYSSPSGDSTEIALIGFDGMVGVPLFMGGNTTPSRAVVQCPGAAFRLPAAVLKMEFSGSPSVQVLLLRYLQALITQISQTAVCNRHHALEQRLCRWLLMCLDLLPSSKLFMTQEMIADQLGVRREGVTDAARKLMGRGMIRYSRGHLEVLDRNLLEHHACECYQVVKTEAERLFPAGQHVRDRLSAQC